MRNPLLPTLIFALVYFAFFIYPPLRISWLMFPLWAPGTLILMMLMVGPAAGRLAYEFYPGPATRWLSSVMMTWAGVCFIGLVLLLPFELLNLVWSMASPKTGSLLFAATFALGFLGFLQAQHLETTTVSIPVPADAPERARGLSYAQISDVHVGSRSARLLKRVVNQVNQLNANAVFITGDLIDFSDISAQQLAPLADITAPAYFCIGNHERYVDLDAICERLQQVGVIVLRNKSLDLYPLQVLGIDDAEERDKVATELQHLKPLPDRFRILLYHRPDGAEAAADWGAHLMLCGHTHNGQIFPFNFLVRRVFPRIAGKYWVGDLQLYVSRGTGTWGPILRLGSTGEITHLKLD